MANMEPLRREDHPELEELWRLYDDSMSFVPNSLFTMARRPEILRAFSELITQIWRTGTVPVGTQAARRDRREHRRRLPVLPGSRDGGRQAPRRAGREDRADLGLRALGPVLGGRTHRAAIREGRERDSEPGDPEHFEELRAHWDEGEIVEILAVVGLFGFLNRWNDSMATDLEETPTAFAGRTIGPHGWEPGKHA